jgi:hypothetical protein
VSFTSFSENGILPNSSQRHCGLSGGYMDSLLRLTLLAPDIVETIVDGRQPGSLSFPRLLAPFPMNSRHSSARSRLAHLPPAAASTGRLGRLTAVEGSPPGCLLYLRQQTWKQPAWAHTPWPDLAESGRAALAPAEAGAGLRPRSAEVPGAPAGGIAGRGDASRHRHQPRGARPLQHAGQPVEERFGHGRLAQDCEGAAVLGMLQPPGPGLARVPGYQHGR